MGAPCLFLLCAPRVSLYLKETPSHPTLRHLQSPSRNFLVPVTRVRLWKCSMCLARFLLLFNLNPQWKQISSSSCWSWHSYLHLQSTNLFSSWYYHVPTSHRSCDSSWVLMPGTWLLIESASIKTLALYCDRVPPIDSSIWRNLCTRVSREFFWAMATP